MYAEYIEQNTKDIRQEVILIYKQQYHFLLDIKCQIDRIWWQMNYTKNKNAQNLTLSV